MPQRTDGIAANVNDWNSRFEPTRQKSEPPDDARAGSQERSPVDVRDDDVRFTVYRPRAVAPERWYSLVAFAHKTDAYDDPDRGRVDPIEDMQAIAARVLDGADDFYDHTDSDATRSLPRGSELRFVPAVEGVIFNPPDVAFAWLEPVHYENFRFRPSAALNGSRARGTLSVFLGALLVGEVSLTINVDANAARRDSQEPNEVEQARPYRRIFASYSHQDIEIVKLVGTFVSLTGDQFVRDWVELRSGEFWDDRLRNMIQDADVFQLFWSRRSMISPFVRNEWEYALSLRRNNFVRPVFWEQPMPTQPAEGLPPPELQRLHFQAIDFDFSALTRSASPAIDDAHEDGSAANVQKTFGEPARVSSVPGTGSRTRDDFREGPNPDEPSATQKRREPPAAPPPELPEVIEAVIEVSDAFYQAVGQFTVQFEWCCDSLRRAIARFMGIDATAPDNFALTILGDVQPMQLIVRFNALLPAALQTATDKTIGQSLATRFERLVETRNAIVHGAWVTETGGPVPRDGNFIGWKIRYPQAGLLSKARLKNATEISYHAAEAEALARIFAGLANEENPSLQAWLVWDRDVGWRLPDKDE